MRGKKLDDHLTRPHDFVQIQLAISTLKIELSSTVSNLFEEVSMLPPPT